MAEEIHFDIHATRPERYRIMNEQIKALTAGETDLIANLSNTVAILKQSFGFFWVGFYLVKNDELVLGPYQGTVACTRIKKGKGVCGTSWEKAQTVIVEDVDKFPGHIACSSASRSEIVVPVIKNGIVVMVLDADSDKLNDFNEEDKTGLEKTAELVAGWC